MRERVLIYEVNGCRERQTERESLSTEGKEEKPIGLHRKSVSSRMTQS